MNLGFNVARSQKYPWGKATTESQPEATPGQTRHSGSSRDLYRGH